MISILRRQPEPPGDDFDQLMQLMIKQSENTAADAFDGARARPQPGANLHHRRFAENGL